MTLVRNLCQALPKPKTLVKTKLLKRKLDSLRRSYGSEHLATDPLMFLHRYTAAEDREVVGLVCSVLAYGRVAIIQHSIRRILGLMGTRPAEYVRRFDAPARRRDFSDFSHRFHRGDDMILLLHWMRKMLEEEGSIGGFFHFGYSPGDVDVGSSLTCFVERTLALDCTPVYPGGTLPAKAGVRHFFPSPTRGSACKRLNLYLRWMVRRNDGLDLGLWDFMRPSQLVIPLDTHIARICHRIGLTNRTSSGWPMAVDITEGLRRLDPDDPVKYDFAISRLGILNKCPATPVPHKCGACEIKSICER